jgi:hypothetical protein
MKFRHRIQSENPEKWISPQNADPDLLILKDVHSISGVAKDISRYDFGNHEDFTK